MRQPSPPDAPTSSSPHSGGSARDPASACEATDDSRSPGSDVAPIVRDATQRRSLEDQLRRTAAYFQSIVENSSEVVSVVDERGIIRARPSLAPDTVDMFGRREADVLEVSALDLAHPDDRPRLQELLERAIRFPDEEHSIECRILSPDGESRWVLITARNLLHEPAVRGIVSRLRDITVQKAAETALIRAKEAAEAADHAKSEFLATISHELRSPLHAIIGYADMLQEGAFGQLGDEQLEAVKCIRRRAGDQYALIAAVLDLTAMDAGQLPVERSSFVVRDLFTELESESAETWPKARVPIVWSCAPDVDALGSDRGKVKVILHNLVGNAVKFTEHGAVTVDARAVAGGVELGVSDTGIGIPPDSIDGIFEPFRQVDASESRRYEGSGLGLHTVKRLAELLGGSVAVRSEPGRGSSFVVRLPSRGPTEERPVAAAHV